MFGVGKPKNRNKSVFDFVVIISMRKPSAPKTRSISHRIALRELVIELKRAARPFRLQINRRLGQKFMRRNFEIEF
jgi:hypothetical protein